MLAVDGDANRNKNRHVKKKECVVQCANERAKAGGGENAYVYKQRRDYARLC